MTNLNEQIQRQNLWRPRIKCSFSRLAQQLVQEEFIEDIDSEQHNLNFKKLIRFCLREIPFYQQQKEIFETYLESGAIENSILPILTKRAFQDHHDNFKPRNLPQGVVVSRLKKTSGTTGRPTIVEHSQGSELSFALLKQREYRWFNYNPSLTFASIRLPTHLPKMNGKDLTLQASFKGEAWPLVGTYYKTGSCYAYSVLNAIEEQLKWLNQHQPHYLLAYAENLEHLALANQDIYKATNLTSLLAISETLSDDMRFRITQKFNVPIQQNYGLNELGLVASRCLEGGRYHVHREFFYVEIIDEQGRACRPGEKGRIIITSLSNYAMPLIRYDTDDFAYATDQNCPCGRKLPCFGEVLGRYSRIAYLPAGTLAQVAIIREALCCVPSDLGKDLLKFQIRHLNQHEFMLCLELRNHLSKELEQYFVNFWSERQQDKKYTFSLEQVQAFTMPKNGKFQDFISDAMPSLP